MSACRGSDAEALGTTGTEVLLAGGLGPSTMGDADGRPGGPN